MKYTFSISQSGGGCYLTDQEFNNSQEESDFYNKIAKNNEKVIGTIKQKL